MPTARKLPSGSWRCQVFSHWEYTATDDGRIEKKRVYRSFTCDTPGPRGKREAERMAAEFAVDKELAKHCTLTLGECLDRYIDGRSRVLSPNTIREYRRARKAVLPELMDKRLDKITQEDVQLAINDACLNHAPKTVRNMHGLISAVMAAYRPDFALHTVLPKKTRPNLYTPSDEDVRLLLEAVKDTEMEIPVLLAAFGPMRRGEICALDSKHIKGNVVHVEWSMAKNEDHEWVIKRPKSYAGDRFIMFPDFVIEKIKGKEGRIVELNPDQVSNRFVRIMRDLDIPHFRFHDLRHYCASIQHALGIPDAYIMQRGGWGSDAVLKEVYRHAMDEKTAEMNAVANAHFAALCNTPCNTEEKNPLF